MRPTPNKFPHRKDLPQERDIPRGDLAGKAIKRVVFLSSADIQNVYCGDVRSVPLFYPKANL